MPKTETGTCIRMAMEKGNVSAADLAASMGVSNSTLSRWRKEGPHSVGDLEKIAKLCGMTVIELMALAD